MGLWAVFKEHSSHLSSLDSSYLIELVTLNASGKAGELVYGLVIWTENSHVLANLSTANKKKLCISKNTRIVAPMGSATEMRLRYGWWVGKVEGRVIRNQT